MAQLGLTSEFKRQVLQWNGATVHMKESINLLGQYDLAKRKMCEVAMKTEKPAFTWEATERTVKILESAYTKADLEQLVSASQLIAEEINLLLSLLEDFEGLFDSTLGDWANEPVDLELKPYYKPFNIIYYPVPRTKKKIFRKELKRLV